MGRVGKGSAKLLELKNLIGGIYKDSAIHKVLPDFSGQDCAKIYSATDIDIRRMKRGITVISDQLRFIPVKEIIQVIETSAQYYFAHPIDIEDLIRLTGSPKAFIIQEIKSRKYWLKNISAFVKNCFSGDGYRQSSTVHYPDLSHAYKQYSSNGVVIGFLPSNSDAESLYLIVQILLSRSPAIIRSSSSASSNFSALKYMYALTLAIDTLNNPLLEALKKSVNIINLFHLSSLAEVVKTLHVAKATYVVFGSNETILTINNALKGFKHGGTFIKMGTGLSASILLQDADIDLAVETICRSVTVDNGNQCIACTILYIEALIYDTCIGRIKNMARAFSFGDPFSADSQMGSLSEFQKIKIISYLKSRGLFGLNGVSSLCHMLPIELRFNQEFDELPGPVLFIKKIFSYQEAIQDLQHNLYRKGMKKNLTVSLFTNNEKDRMSLCDTLPSFNCKINKGTHEINLFLEHQGTYLLKEFVDFKVIEI